MLKLKIGTENNMILIGPPNKILNQTHSKFYAKTSSLVDRISIELYHILSEETFNPDAPKTDFKNLRLLSHEQLLIKNIPFDLNVAKNFRLLMPLQNSGSIASFNFDFYY